MLVYIARSVAANPSQDPELWPYLEQLVRREDETYEEEVMKLKSEKVSLIVDLLSPPSFTFLLKYSILILRRCRTMMLLKKSNGNEKFVPCTRIWKY